MGEIAAAGLREAPDALSEAARCLRAGSRIALARVISTWGSSPVPVGGMMVIADDERFWGSVSGGCVETEVIVNALEVIGNGRPTVLDFGVAHETAWDAGLPCGGEMRVFLERLEGVDGLGFVEGLLSARLERKAVFIKTGLADGRREVSYDGASLSDGEREFFRAGQSLVIASGDGEAFLHSMVPGPRVFIIGATQISRTLAQLCSMVAFDAIVIDPREAYASEARFAGVRREVGWPVDVFEGLGLDEQTAVVALAHVAEIDDQGLVAALRAPCRYIGALGSVRNHARRTKRLEAQGFSPEVIGRIHCPVGLDIGARQPSEIALSVMAELILSFRGKRRG